MTVRTKPLASFGMLNVNRAAASFLSVSFFLHSTCQHALNPRRIHTTNGGLVSGMRTKKYAPSLSSSVWLSFHATIAGLAHHHVRLAIMDLSSLSSLKSGSPQERKEAIKQQVSSEIAMANVRVAVWFDG